MPGEEENSRKMVVSNMENTKSKNDSIERSQPRQPTSLQGLLRFAMEATKAEDASNESQFSPMDEERKKFLEDALKTMTIDVVQVLQTQIKKLQNVESLNDNSNVSEHSEALETIMDYIDNIDIANDFYKIGGFMILKPCLNCKNAAIKAGGCGLLAELCQNNPYCQKIVLDNDFIPILINILDMDTNDSVGIKALYALSGIVRENSEAYAQLIQYGGLNILLKTIQKDEDKFRIKSAFLLSSLCRSEADFKSRLIFLDYLPVLIKLVSEPRRQSHEHLLSLLVCLTEENATAINECKNPTYNFKEVLLNIVKEVQNNEEYQEMEQYCKRLLHLVFNC